MKPKYILAVGVAFVLTFGVLSAFSAPASKSSQTENELSAKAASIQNKNDCF